MKCTDHCLAFQLAVPLLLLMSRAYMLLGGAKGAPKGLNFCNSREELLMRSELTELNDGRCSWRTLEGGLLRWRCPCGLSSFLFLEIGNCHLVSVMCSKE